MSQEILEAESSRYVTTRTAARMLGLSTTMVQLMLDKNEIEGWKTPGGHRRISTLSLLEFRKKKNITLPGLVDATQKPLIMVVSEDEVTRGQLQQGLARRPWPFGFCWPVSLETAMADLLRVRPCQFVVDLQRPAEAPEGFLDTLDALRTLGMKTVITIVGQTQLPVLATDSDIQFAPGPMNAEWLQVFLAGLQASQLYLKKKEV